MFRCQLNLSTTIMNYSSKQIYFTNFIYRNQLKKNFGQQCLQVIIFCRNFFYIVNH